VAQIRRLGPTVDAPPRPGVPAPTLARPVVSHVSGRDNGRSTGDVVIDVRDLVKTYPDGTAAVKGISFQVRKGELFGLLGPNGAGKTTTMRILGTLHQASAGSARILGLDVNTQGAAIRQRIGFALQEAGLDELATAQEMLVLHARLYGIPKAEARRRAAELLRIFNLEKQADKTVTKFSGGMRRRLDLAVSLIHEPEVLILDEPTAGLDPTSRGELWNVLRRLRHEKGLTVIMSTHYMEEADALCDRIAFVNAGRIAAIDTPANLKRGLGGDLLRIKLGAPALPGQADALRRQFGADRVRFQDGVLDLSVSDASRVLLPVLRAVTDVGLRVESTQMVTPTLDDVFRRYTGATLQEPGEKEAKAEAPKGGVQVSFSRKRKKKGGGEA